jgi:hypothetical protein
MIYTTTPVREIRSGTERTTEATQALAARIAGFTLLLLMVSGFTGMFAFGGNHIVDGDAAATAHNILVHEQGFRGSLAYEIVMLNCDVVLARAWKQSRRRFACDRRSQTQGAVELFPDEFRMTK